MGRMAEMALELEGLGGPEQESDVLDEIRAAAQAGDRRKAYGLVMDLQSATSPARRTPQQMAEIYRAYDLAALVQFHEHR